MDEIKEVPQKTSAKKIPAAAEIDRLIKGEESFQDPVYALKKQKKANDYVFKLTGNFRKNEHGLTVYPVHVIDNMDFVYDPTTDTKRQIRLLNGVDTLWVDEQREQGITDDVAKSLRPYLVFNDGELRVRSSDKLKATFLQMKNCCASNPHRDESSHVRYELIDPQAKEDDMFRDEERQYEAWGLAYNATYEEMMPHALYLNCKTTREDGEPMSEKGIRVQYMEVAKKNPKLFIETFHNPIVKINFMIANQMKLENIFVDRQAMRAKWKTGAIICPIPEKKNPLQVMVDFAITPAGSEFKKELEQMSR
jgi:hypothetical protein